MCVCVHLPAKAKPFGLVLLQFLAESKTDMEEWREAVERFNGLNSQNKPNGNETPDRPNQPSSVPDNGIYYEPNQMDGAWLLFMIIIDPLPLFLFMYV